jgi:hypothetical protein
MDPDRLVTLAEFSTLQEAEIVKGLLIANGIDAYVPKGTSWSPPLAPNAAIFAFIVQIRVEDAETARELLRSCK